MTEFDSYSIDSILSLTYGRQQTFLALSLLYDECGWGTMKHHQDHVFPRKSFKWNELGPAGRESWFELKDRVGNLCLLLAHENQEKSAKPFEEWLQTRDKTFRQRHLIPDDPTLFKFERFDDFISAREELIKRRLQLLFGNP